MPPPRPYQHSRFSVPSQWETWASNTRNQNALAFLKVEGMRVKYVGPGEDDRQAATIMANHPAPADCPLYYFEVEVVNRGQEGFIGIGFQRDDVVLHRLPGWEAHSYGYHGDDGHCFAGNGRGMPYGPRYTSGDVIGALLNRADKTISYFKNGTSLGVAFSDVTEERLHPCVGLRTRAEEVIANFGAEPFVTDFDVLQSGYQAQVLATVRATPAPMVSSRGTPLLPQLLHDHLLHHRCSETAAIIARDLLVSQGADGNDLGTASTSAAGPSSATDTAAVAAASARHAIFENITAGRLQQATTELSALLGPSFLDGEPGLAFRIRVQTFCELLRPGGVASTEAALGYGRQALASHTPRGPAEEELLCDALSLLAYESPESSPCGHLMSQAYRNALADAINCAVLKHQGLPTVSPLERILQQTTAVVAELQAQNHSAAQVLDVHKIVFGPTTPGSGAENGAGPAPKTDGAADGEEDNAFWDDTFGRELSLSL